MLFERHEEFNSESGTRLISSMVKSFIYLELEDLMSIPLKPLEEKAIYFCINGGRLLT